jgi:hypothetical protein
MLACDWAGEVLAPRGRAVSQAVLRRRAGGLENFEGRFSAVHAAQAASTRKGFVGNLRLRTRAEAGTRAHVNSAALAAHDRPQYSDPTPMFPGAIAFALATLVALSAPSFAQDSGVHRSRTAASSRDRTPRPPARRTSLRPTRLPRAPPIFSRGSSGSIRATHPGNEIEGARFLAELLEAEGLARAHPRVRARSRERLRAPEGNRPTQGAAAAQPHRRRSGGQLGVGARGRTAARS